jgi:hypothetical protein
MSTDLRRTFLHDLQPVMGIVMQVSAAPIESAPIVGHPDGKPAGFVAELD